MAAEWIALGGGLALVDRGRHARARAAQVRTETAACSQRVVLPQLGISAELPVFEEVAVEPPARQPGAQRFRCQKDAVRGSVIVASGERSG